MKMSLAEPIYVKFENETVDEAVESINNILQELYEDNRWIVYFSCKIFYSEISLFLSHVQNVYEQAEYKFHVFDIPEHHSHAQQVLYDEFIRVQNDGWYIKTSRIMDNRCCLFLNKRYSR